MAAIPRDERIEIEAGVSQVWRERKKELELELVECMKREGRLSDELARTRSRMMALKTQIDNYESAIEKIDNNE